MNKIEALKPCPFCGSEASADGKVTYSKDHVREQGWEQDTFYFCNCPTCGVSNVGIIGHRTRGDAIEAWNRRASPTLPSSPVCGDDVFYDDLSQSIRKVEAALSAAQEAGR